MSDINLDEEMTVPHPVPESAMKLDYRFVSETGGVSARFIPEWMPHSDYHNEYIEKLRKAAEEEPNISSVRGGIWWPGKGIKWIDEPKNDKP